MNKISNEVGRTSLSTTSTFLINAGKATCAPWGAGRYVPCT